MLSKSGIHAVRALVTLAELERGAYAGTVSIAEKIGAPRNYLGKLLQQLSRQGILESQKGLGGGFRLARDASEITLLEVVQTLDQLDRWGMCILGRAKCGEENLCPIHHEWKEIKEGYLHLLSHTKIADLLNGTSTNLWQ